MKNGVNKSVTVRGVCRKRLVGHGCVVYRSGMSRSLDGRLGLAVLLLAACVGTRAGGQATGAGTDETQGAEKATAATNLPQGLKLIPIPREVTAGAMQSLAGGVADQLRGTLRGRRCVCHRRPEGGAGGAGRGGECDLGGEYPGDAVWDASGEVYRIPMPRRACPESRRRRCRKR